jgi:hypothetical protein
MWSFLKGLGYVAGGAVALAVAAVALVAVGIPLLAIGAVILGVMGVVVFALSLPVLILGAVFIGLIAAFFALFAGLVGVGILAAKLTLIAILAVMGLRFVGKLIFGGRKSKSKSRPELAEPVRDPLEVQAELELDKEIGFRS